MQIKARTISYQIVTNPKINSKLFFLSLSLTKATAALAVSTNVTFNLLARNSPYAAFLRYTSAVEPLPPKTIAGVFSKQFVSFVSSTHSCNFKPCMQSHRLINSKYRILVIEYGEVSNQWLPAAQRQP